MKTFCFSVYFAGMSRRRHPYRPATLSADRALTEPVTITKNGRERLVLLSAEEYARLKRHERSGLRAEDLTEDEAQLTACAEAPAETAHLDKLLEDDEAS